MPCHQFSPLKSTFSIRSSLLLPSLVVCRDNRRYFTVAVQSQRNEVGRISGVLANIRTPKCGLHVLGSVSRSCDNACIRAVLVENLILCLRTAVLHFLDRDATVCVLEVSFGGTDNDCGGIIAVRI